MAGKSKLDEEDEEDDIELDEEVFSWGSFWLADFDSENSSPRGVTFSVLIGDVNKKLDADEVDLFPLLFEDEDVTVML